MTGNVAFAGEMILVSLVGLLLVKSTALNKTGAAKPHGES